MKSQFFNALRTHPEAPLSDTVKRAIGASALLLISIPAPNKQGWTPSFVLNMSDALGAQARGLAQQAMNYFANPPPPFEPEVSVIQQNGLADTPNTV